MKNLLAIIFVLFIAYQSRENDSRIASQDAFFQSLQSNDIALKAPVDGEWLYEHKEPGQTFEEYRNASPVRITKNKNTIFLQPYGQFSKEQNDILQYTADYLTIFFQVKTQLLTGVADSIIPSGARRKKEPFGEQLLAPYIIDSLLKTKIPTDGIVMMAITEKDLYPKEDWNYVFGLASYYNKVGVSSMRRLCDNIDDSANYNMCLFRLIQVASHEIGHMFSLHHCTNAKCTMNGSNSLPESDRQPNRLCSECVKKLNWNIGFDNKKRLNELQAYFEKHKLSKDWRLATADIEKADNK